MLCAERWIVWMYQPLGWGQNVVLLDSLDGAMFWYVCDDTYCRQLPLIVV